MGQRGAASVVMLAIGIVVVVCGLFIADLGVYLAARASAQVAADAAALAAAPVTFRPAATGPSPTALAAQYAIANGAELVECVCRSDDSWRERTVHVRVVIAVDLVLLAADLVGASSSAEFDPTQLPR